MTIHHTHIRGVVLFLMVLLFQGNTGILHAQAVNKNDPALKGIDVVEHLGGKLPLDLTFTDENGKTVQLGDFFDGKRPVIMALAYYECPMLCTLVLNGIADGVKGMTRLTPGKDFQILTISINPKETADLALKKQKTYLEATGNKVKPEDWTFCVGQQENIKPLADSLGFKYYYDKKIDNYAHPAVIYLLTPDGTISRYLYGTKYKSQDLRLGLLEASQGNIGSTVQRVLLYCYHYDPDAKGYVLFAANVMKLGGVATLVILGVFLGLLWVRDRRRKLSHESNSSGR